MPGDGHSRSCANTLITPERGEGRKAKPSLRWTCTEDEHACRWWRAITRTTREANGMASAEVAPTAGYMGQS